MMISKHILISIPAIGLCADNCCWKFFIRKPFPAEYYDLKVGKKFFNPIREKWLSWRVYIGAVGKLILTSHIYI